MQEEAFEALIKHVQEECARNFELHGFFCLDCDLPKNILIDEMEKKGQSLN